jgi:hypothetical protein
LIGYFIVTLHVRPRGYLFGVEMRGRKAAADIFFAEIEMDGRKRDQQADKANGEKASNPKGEQCQRERACRGQRSNPVVIPVNSCHRNVLERQNSMAEYGVSGSWRLPTSVPGQSLAPPHETALAQEVAHLRRRVPVQRQRVQAAQDQMIALARQVGRAERNGVIP